VQRALGDDEFKTYLEDKGILPSPNGKSVAESEYREILGVKAAEEKLDGVKAAEEKFDALDTNCDGLNVGLDEMNEMASHTSYSHRIAFVIERSSEAVLA